MVSRAQLIVVTAIVAIGLMGPMAFIAQEAAKNPAEEAAEATKPVQQTVQLSQVIELEAIVTAEITRVDPILVAVVASDFGDNETVAILSNLSSAGLDSIDGEGHVFRAVFMLADPTEYSIVLGELAGLNMTVVDQGMTAQIILPKTYTAYRGGHEYTLSTLPSDEVTAIISGEAQSGPAEFSLKITKSGEQKKIVAVEN
ncbi:MAG: hypothetical protein KAW41_01980 [Candidatus Diapherotrites archaeon]|nr:hypothetical protein [Candidatus Diapherotrites archaeon]